MKTVTNATELGKAVENEEQEITIEGDLANKVVKIKATGKVAWVIAFGAVTLAIVAVLASPSVALGPAGVITEGALITLATGTAASAVAIWGLGTTVAAISIGLGGKGAKALRKLKENYEVIQKGSSKAVLRKIQKK